VTLLLSIGIAVAIARGAVAVLWPGVEGPAVIAFRVVAAGFLGGLVAHFLGRLLGIVPAKPGSKGGSG
jgi:hypothetical protein